ncbi:hypothetical protein LMG31506_05433 [Cupriavidus yeoncheonensis]|uniref:DUF4145 domain-containing protein n=1 Tax=Cupriavidus yeoncheonensis TaxID=1462994 RepID=A0A916IZ46_9BURK|nr:DUF4145 domain-containing protein [Cupriavidus yeoncheonensis]CAG2155517.1 hypothetical protein LMG31506_05433 [Cupriavidus yeoncheonensis]
MSRPATQVLWTHCNECGHETKHEVVHNAERRRTYDNDQYSVEVGSTWTVLQCGGCEEVSMRRVDWCSDDDPQDGPNTPTFFPARVSRRKPVWLGRYDVPSADVDILEEIYKALHADSRRLAMMGARALFDVVITRTVGDQGSFAKGLDELVNSDLISKRDRGIIEAAIEAGHAAIHRGHQPTSDDVNVVIDIAERLIHAEVLQAQASALAASTPPRKRASAKKKL